MVVLGGEPMPEVTQADKDRAEKLRFALELIQDEPTNDLLIGRILEDIADLIASIRAENVAQLEKMAALEARCEKLAVALMGLMPEVEKLHTQVLQTDCTLCRAMFVSDDVIAEYEAGKGE